MPHVPCHWINAETWGNAIGVAYIDEYHQISDPSSPYHARYKERHGDSRYRWAPEPPPEGRARKYSGLGSWYHGNHWSHQHNRVQGSMIPRVGSLRMIVFTLKWTCNIDKYHTFVVSSCKTSFNITFTIRRQLTDHKSPQKGGVAIFWHSGRLLLLRTRRTSHKQDIGRSQTWNLARRGLVEIRYPSSVKNNARSYDRVLWRVSTANPHSQKMRLAIAAFIKGIMFINTSAPNANRILVSINSEL